jgi:BCD family chlorophyll transporter-like MFS transporter
MLLAFGLSSRLLSGGSDPIRIAGAGVLIGTLGFAAIIFAGALGSSVVFRLGTAGIGFGHGLFAVGTLTSAMLIGRDEFTGMAVGAWGAVQTTATGVALFAGGALRDLLMIWVEQGYLGGVMAGPVAAYGGVYYLEIFILFAGLAALGPLVRKPGEQIFKQSGPQLADFPG